MTPWARFDDLVAGTAVVCPPPYRVLVASRTSEVAGVLDAVSRAAAGGDWAFGYVSYEAAPGLDPALAALEPGVDDLPLAWFGLCGEPLEATPVGAARATAASPTARWITDWTADEHARAVGIVREHIAAGDTYQINLTDRLRMHFHGDPAQLYAALAGAQRGAYHAYLDLGRHVIASASPELFFERRGTRLRTRPMKGTAARGRTPDEDREQARRLRASAKERAENVMIVDLLRNDLARVAQVGSVEVTELCALERYPTVWQLTSEITATLRPGCGMAEIFRALFPCGSVTGAPKASSMRIIRDIETGPRGVYCGAVGLVGPDTATFNVAIRTAVVDRERKTAVYGAGGGITWDSDPAAEHAELLAKAKVLGDVRDRDDVGVLGL
ncbi:aminodeoxychorismate synthase component I [Actinoplanes sp. NPDC051633]|uniref:aminodeoxychorismate synthase component I n=1 Tax=Actinoplanes sp. NPDC051633 TaxID=3155670 RepID=UPI00342729FA